MLPGLHPQINDVTTPDAKANNQLKSRFLPPALLAPKKRCGLSGGDARAFIARLSSCIGAVTGAFVSGLIMGALGGCAVYGDEFIADNFDGNKIALFTGEGAAIMQSAFLLLHGFYRRLMIHANQDPKTSNKVTKRLIMLLILAFPALVVVGALFCNRIFDGNLPPSKLAASAATGALAFFPAAVAAASYAGSCFPPARIA